MKWSEVLEAWSDSLKSVAGMEFKVLLIPIVWDYNFYQALNKGLCKDTQSLTKNKPTSYYAAGNPVYQGKTQFWTDFQELGGLPNTGMFQHPIY